MATMLHCFVHNVQQPRSEDSSGYSMEVEQKVERKFVSQFPESVKLLLENR